MSRPPIDMTGQKFGDLEVIKLSDKRGANNRRYWECKCKCGNIAYATGSNLRSGHYKSCGCKQGVKGPKVEEHLINDCVDGTRLSMLKSKLRVNNSSGHKGIHWCKSSKKWRAYICFKRKQIMLGYFTELSDAIKARKAAEEKYHMPYLQDRPTDHIG